MPRASATLLPLVLLVAPLLVLGAPSTARAKDRSPGPGQPIYPLPGQKDAALYDKAARLQAGMWFHISPEGVLAYRHRQNATPAQLSHDTTALSDVAIWTGCYAASQACRWHVTRDPDALAQARTLARGLATMTEVTGDAGALARNLGRPIPGEKPGEPLVPSPRGDGLWFDPDSSRDQLTGVVLGWAMLWKYVDDPEIKALAQKHAPAIARRLYGNGMWICDYTGQHTRFGELRPDVEWLPFRKNGLLASIGLATISTGLALDPTPDLQGHLDALRDDGWVKALPQQNAFLSAFMNGPNANMAHLALLTCVLVGPPDVADGARHGMSMLRVATRGWWNAGLCACQLLAGGVGDPAEILGELRRTLHDMSELEVQPAGEELISIDRISTVAEKGTQEWTWADSPRRTRVYHPVPSDVAATLPSYTRADYLFAYWLARAAGSLVPRVGPGKDPTASRVPVRLPPWMKDAPPR